MSPRFPSPSGRPPKRTPRRHRREDPPATRGNRAPPAPPRPKAPLVVTRDGASPGPGTCVILHKDQHVVLVDKAAGLLTVRTDQGNPPTVMGWLHHRLKGAHDQLYPVHRLDRDTSGVLVVARTRHALGLLVAQLRQRAFHRVYLALVRGTPPRAGTVVGWLGTVGRDLRMRALPQGQGQVSITHFKVLQQCGGAALVALKLESGRRNQIRVHLAELGFPLMGESQYAPAVPGDPMARQALHSHRLRLTHPVTPQVLEGVSPLPGDMAFVWKKLGGDLPTTGRDPPTIPGEGAPVFFLRGNGTVEQMPPGTTLPALYEDTPD